MSIYCIGSKLLYIELNLGSGATKVSDLLTILKGGKILEIQ